MDSVEIGVIDNFDKNYDYSIVESGLEYREAIKKYRCISISDDVFYEYVFRATDMDTYFQNYSSPMKGLEHYGETIIPPKSIIKFIDIIKKVQIPKNESISIKSLLNMAEVAHKQGKYLICFGI